MHKLQELKYGIHKLHTHENCVDQEIPISFQPARFPSVIIIVQHDTIQQYNNIVEVHNLQVVRV